MPPDLKAHAQIEASMTDARSSFAKRQASQKAVRAEARELRSDSTRLLRQILVTTEGPAETLNEADAIRSLVRDHLASIRSAIVVKRAAEAPDALAAALAASGLDPDEVTEMTDGLIAAYRSAVAADDSEMMRLLGHALRMIGRGLAQQIGPKAAGVTLN
ncbi:hypothetical protein Q8W71_30080 [Methylobacterium sp. NEAU 140]|uniref:hypothetical protein n=1 Tax=Methylobacterium sp. NEAU 140 TaxID=3064945 RepID=UPI00273702E9|nr:hypothetical protein [Methylobacterium sp. NEAU 140]MDP4026850.1 hypothetical protein [Methylobacterium sp. NEAU 140]